MVDLTLLFNTYSMICSPVDYHLKFMGWFKESYPDLEEKYSRYVVLHLKKNVITIRKADLDEPTLEILYGIIEKFKQEFG